MSGFDLLGSLQRGEAPFGPGAAGAPGSSPAQGAPEAAPQCSRKGCRADAAWDLAWNNPKIHTPERRKHWLACDEHRDWLADYLSTRGFLREITPFTSLPQEG